MIHDLDSTLKELLKRHLPAELAAQVEVSFAAPDNQFPGGAVTLPAVDLFLYDVRENRELRSNEWLIERQNGIATRTPAPVRVDCSYLITAWSSAADNPAQDEHRILGEVMHTLLRFPTLPTDVLKGSLATTQDYFLPTSSLQPGRLQSLGEFWQALGGKPKAALNYTVTIAVARLEPTQAHIVTEKIINVDLKE
jgi:hypothetical protein